MALGRHALVLLIFEDIHWADPASLHLLRHLAMSLADARIAGYDNITVAAVGPIGLTSVDQAGPQIGAKAARLVLQRIADRERSSAFVSTSPCLVVRRTTAPPPA
jgi:DNA-binding LacI/PurR family transcriptional regulator